MSNRTISLIVAALLALLIASCSQSTDIAPVQQDAMPNFELSPIERNALESGDESGLDVTFGDPALGSISNDAAPSADMVAELQGTRLTSEARTTSCYTPKERCKKHHKTNCSKCKKEKEPKKCRKVAGICNISERFWKVADCCAQTADVTYAARVDFDDADGNLKDVEVVFKRDGTEVGRANTDKDGVAYFTDKGVARGPHNVMVCVAETTTTDCGCNDNNNTSGCSGKGSDGHNKNDGKDNAPCDGNAGKGNDSRSSSCVKTPPPPCTPPPPPPSCGCGDDTDTCIPCTTTALDGWFCSSIDFAVYTDCIKGSVTGTGYFPSCNPLRVGLRNGMNFRLAYDNGAVQGTLNYWDGDTKLTEAQVKWLIIDGAESWFGGDNWMAHVVDGGADPTQDFFEVWIKDPETCTCYHCGGKLTGCYVHVSYKYTQKCN
jgi:hypothetical protein